MSSQQTSPLADSDINEADVEDYLSRHPEFFEQRASLLDGLRLPHDGGTGSVSLVERQLTVMRQKNLKLEKRLHELVEVARSNHDVSERVHELAMRLIGCDGPDEIVAVLESTLRQDFDAADSVVVLFQDADEAGQGDEPRFLRRVERSSSALKPFATFLEQARPRCGTARDTQLDFLFPEHAVEIGSIALVPLGEDAALGMLAIGSRDARRFHPGMSTDFLDRLGQLFSAALVVGND